MFFLYKKYQNPNPNNTKNQQETQNPDKKKKLMIDLTKTDAHTCAPITANNNLL